MKNVFSVLIFISLLIGIIAQNVEEAPTSEENSSTSVPEPQSSVSVEEISDWEKELDEELKEQDKQKDALKDSRATTLPTSNPNQINRSFQNLMMDIAVAVDLVGEYDKNKPKTTENKLDVRTAEFGFRAAIDQWTRGYFLAAAHNENGAYYFEVHEAYLQFPFLPYNFSFRAGSMFLDIGRLNRVHSHDRPFTKSPIVHEKFLGWESLFDTGGELSLLLPWSFITQELVIGVTNGQKYGHAHSAGITKNNPLGYAHFKNFYYLGNNWGTQFGFSGVRYEPTTDRRNEKFLYGMDAILKWNRSNLKGFELLAEYWLSKETFPTTVDYQKLEISSPQEIKQYGYYIFADWKFHQLWSIGYRYDFFSDLSIRDQYGSRQESSIEANSIQITFRSSEFALLRGTFERRFIREMADTSDPEKVDQRFFVQGTIIMGTHPAHEY